MNITGIESQVRHVPLKRPYSIAFMRCEAVDLVTVRVAGRSGLSGTGSATPSPEITGETLEQCGRALDPLHLKWLLGRDVRDLPGLVQELETALPATPAARAALDMALHDLWALSLGRPLSDLLGRAHDALPTSITIGLKDSEETLAEADEYLSRGFRILKVKIGESPETDLERLRRLREHVGPSVLIRADANQAYGPAELDLFLRGAAPIRLELLEQPLPPSEDGALRRLPPESRRLLAADESLHSPADALKLASPPAPFGIFNIKLMKCGGLRSAQGIAAIAAAAGIPLMWGCMDESAVGISAALHAALATPGTRFLDLDGSLDLARDFVHGGFRLEGGLLRVTDRPGLGVEAIPF